MPIEKIQQIAFNPIQEKLSTTVGSSEIISEKKKLSSLPFAKLSPATNSRQLNASQTGDSFLEELNTVLTTKANTIDKEIAELEKMKTNKAAFDAIVEAEGWGSWAFDKFASTNENIKGGIEFLEHVLPTKIAELPVHMEKIAKLTTLGGAFLIALDSGLEGLALIYKAKIVTESRQIFDHMQSLTNLHPSKERNSLSPNEKNKLKKLMTEWEIDLRVEEAGLHEEKLQFGINTSYYLIYLLSLPLDYFPTNAFKGIPHLASAGASWMMSGLEVVSYALDLKKNASDFSTFNKWKKDFLTWKNKNETLTDAAHQFEAVDTLIQVSRDLLKKRVNVKNKKIFRLKSRRQEVDGKIQRLKEKSFNKEMKQLFRSYLKKGNASTEGIRQGLEQWRLVSNPTTAVKPLLQVLEKLETNPKHETKEEFIRAFQKWISNSTAMHSQFQTWYRKESAENLDGLLAEYVDYQETIEITTKNALKEMIQKKYEIESRFMNLKLTSSAINFAVVLLCFTVSAILAILAVISLPIAGAGIIVLSLTIGSYAIYYGLIGASYVQAYWEKPNITRLLSLRFQIKRTWIKLHASLRAYFLLAKEKKLLEQAKIVYKLHHHIPKEQAKVREYQLAREAFKQSKKEFEKRQEMVNDWNKRLNTLDAAITEKSWQDFAAQASLQINQNPAAFDTLKAFQEAFADCDLSLLSEETKSLLTIQLGLDLATLQNRVHQDPDAIRSSLQEFFVSDDTSLVSFIKKQKIKHSII